MSPGTRRRRMLEALERRNVPAARKAKKRRPQRVAPAPPPRPRPARRPPGPLLSGNDRPGAAARAGATAATDTGAGATAAARRGRPGRPAPRARAVDGGHSRRRRGRPAARAGPVARRGGHRASRASASTRPWTSRARWRPHARRALEAELEQALAASRADNDAALVAECHGRRCRARRGGGGRRSASGRRAAEERERETLVISGVGEAARWAHGHRRVDGRARRGALRATAETLFVDGGEAARRGVVKLLALGRSRRVVSVARAGRPARWKSNVPSYILLDGVKVTATHWLMPRPRAWRTGRGGRRRR